MYLFLEWDHAIQAERLCRRLYGWSALLVERIAQGRLPLRKGQSHGDREMKLQDAKQECERWLSYLEAQKERSIATQKIASDVRKGVLSSDDGKRALRRLDNAPTVYDGAKLADAVRLLLRQVAYPPPPDSEALLAEIERLRAIRGGYQS